MKYPLYNSPYNWPNIEETVKQLMEDFKVPFVAPKWGIINGEPVQFSNGILKKYNSTTKVWEPVGSAGIDNIGNADQLLTENRVLSGDGELRSLTFEELFAFAVYAKTGILFTVNNPAVSDVPTEVLFTPNAIQVIVKTLINFDGQVKTTKFFEILASVSAGVGTLKQAGAVVFHTHGSNNLFIGPNAGNFTTSGGGTNLAIGGDNLLSITNNIELVAVGFEAMVLLNAGSGNVAVGTYAGYYLTNSTNCVMVGRSAGSGPGATTINNAVLIGQRAGYNSNTNNKINIGTVAVTNTRDEEILIRPTVNSPGWFYSNGLGNNALNSFTPDPGCILDLASTTMGFGFPAMTKAQRDAFTALLSPRAGVSIYQTDNIPGLRTWNGTNWMRYTETAD